LEYWSKAGKTVRKQAIERKVVSLKLSLKHILLIVVFFAMMTGMVSTALRTPVQQNYLMVCFSPDSRHVAILGSRDTQVFDVNTGRQVAVFDLFSYPSGGYLKFVDNEHLMILGNFLDSKQKAVLWFNISNQQEVRRLEFARNDFTEHFTPGHEGFFYDDNTKQTSTYYSNQSDVPKALFQRAPYSRNDDFTLFSFNQYSFFNGTLNELKNPKPGFGELQLENHQQSGGMIELGKYASRAKISPNRKTLIVQREDCYCNYRVSDGKILWKQTSASETGGYDILDAEFAYSPNSKFVAVRVSGTRTRVRVHDCESGERVGTTAWPIENRKLAFAVSSNGQTASGFGTEYGVRLESLLQDSDPVTLAQSRPPCFWLMPAVLYSLGFCVWTWLWAKLPSDSVPSVIPTFRALQLANGIFIVCGMCTAVSWFASDFAAQGVRMLLSIGASCSVIFYFGLSGMIQAWRPRSAQSSEKEEPKRLMAEHAEKEKRQTDDSV
jgi:hypothetical protein